MLDKPKHARTHLKDVSSLGFKQARVLDDEQGLLRTVPALAATR
jgi:hypothetical protein